MTPGDIIDTLHQAMHRYRALQFRALRAAAQDLSHMEFKALRFIAEHPGASASDLVQRSGRDKAQIARLLAELRARGLVEARPAPGDRRSQTLHLSAAGEAVDAQLRDLSEALAAESLSGFSDADATALLALLQRWVGRLQQLEEHASAGQACWSAKPVERDG